MKLMVCGSRSILDTAFIYNQIESLLTEKNIKKEDLVLINGGAKGVDAIAAQWAQSNNVSIELYKPDWAHYGRGAGIVRNKLMVEACDFCLIIWDGVSKGTKNDIELCNKTFKRYKVVKKQN